MELSKIRKVVRNFLLYGILTVLSAIFLIPILWMISGSLKTNYQVFSFPIQWIPNPPIWTNFHEGWTSKPFNTYLKNTLIITTCCVIGRIFVASLVGFGFARLKFYGRDILFVIVLASMILPIHTTIIPLFVIYRYLGWINTFKPLTIPTILSSPFLIFFMRQFFLSLPSELEAAARVDGCSSFGVYWRIYLPLAKPALAALAIFVFMWSWNDFFLPLVVLSEDAKRTLVVGLVSMKDHYGGDWNLIMAVAVLITLPCIMVFIFAQKYFVKGITVGGIKG